MMRHRRVTVLGATGFVGRYIVKHLADQGAVITAVSRHAREAGFLKPMGDVGQIVPIDADMRDDRALDAVVAGAALERQEYGRIFELAGPEIYSFKQLMELLLREIGRKRFLVSIPFGVAAFEAWFLEFLPHPPLTRDQLRLLERDNVASSGLPGLAELGIAPTTLELILPLYLDRFRRGGRTLHVRPA
jgi:uncharacterized protein YbjT (DUF2867 family)